MDKQKAKKIVWVLGILLFAYPADSFAQHEETVSLSSYNDLLERVEQLESMKSAPIYSSSSGCTQSANCGCNSCQQPCGKYFFNTELVLVVPHFGSNTAFIDEGQDIFNSGEDTISTEFDWDLEPSVRFETGYAPQSSGMGWRARYWYFEADTQAIGLNGDYEANFADDSDVSISATDILATQDIRFHVVDLEATNRVTLQGTNITSSAGIRYANAKIHGLYSDIADNNEFNLIENDFEGLGPTVSLDLRRRVMNNLTLFANTRGSILFGSHDYVQVDNENLDFFNQPNDINIVRQENEVVPVAEIQLGAVWERPTNFGSVFLSTAWESQFWSGIGTSAANEGSSGDSSDFQSQRRGDVGFHGVNFGAGLRW